MVKILQYCTVSTVSLCNFRFPSKYQVIKNKSEETSSNKLFECYKYFSLAPDLLTQPHTWVYDSNACCNRNPNDGQLPIGRRPNSNWCVAVSQTQMTKNLLGKIHDNFFCSHYERNIRFHAKKKKHCVIFFR